MDDLSRDPLVWGRSRIEVLVVVAIVGVLVALLLPLFDTGRTFAHLVRCASNLSQISRIASVYHTDWNGTWPSRGEWFWADAMGPYFDISRHPARGDYVSANRLLLCPALPSGRPLPWRCGYQANAHILGAAFPRLEPTPLVRVIAPSETSLFLCGTGLGYTYDAWRFRSGDFGRWHRRSTNVVFVDGHVANRLLGLSQEGSTSFPGADTRLIHPDR